MSSEQINVPSQSTFDGANPMGNKVNSVNKTIQVAEQSRYIPSIQANVLIRNIDNVGGLYEEIVQSSQLTPDYLLQSILQTAHSGNVYEAVHSVETIATIEYDVYTISHGTFTLRDYKRDINNAGATPRGVEYEMKMPTGRDDRLSAFSFYSDTVNTRRVLLRVQGEYLQERPVPHTDTDYTVETYSFEKEVLASDGKNLGGLSCINVGFNKVFLKGTNFITFLSDKIEKINTAINANTHPIALSYVSSTVLSHTAGNFIADDDSREVGILTAGTVTVTDYVIPAPNTSYYVFAIKNTTTGEAKLYVDASLNSPTLPVGFTKKRLVFAFYTNASSQLRPMKISSYRDRHDVEYLSIVNDFSNISIPLSGILLQLTVPLGIEVKALGCFYTNGLIATAVSFGFSHPDIISTAANGLLHTYTGIGGGAHDLGAQFYVQTNTNRQIKASCNQNGRPITRINTQGYTIFT